MGQEKLAAARCGKSGVEPHSAKQEASGAPNVFEPPDRAETEVSPSSPLGAAAAGSDSINPEVDKKVRALRKKLRDIEKLKEKPVAELDTLQKQKISGEAEIIAQIRDLGAEP